MLRCERSDMSYRIELAPSVKLRVRDELAEVALADAYRAKKTHQRLMDGSTMQPNAGCTTGASSRGSSSAIKA